MGSSSQCDEQLGVTVRGYICQSQSSLGSGATLNVHWWQLDLPEMWGQLGKRKLEEGLENQRQKCSSSSLAGPVGTSRGSQEEVVPLEAPGGKLVQPLWRTVWRFLKKLEIDMPYDPAIPLLGIHTEKTRRERDTSTPMFIAALFIIARTWKQPRCPSADEWIRK